jgi:peptide/nickel transport system substrate-binding protein
LQRGGDAVKAARHEEEATMAVVGTRMLEAGGRARGRPRIRATLIAGLVTAGLALTSVPPVAAQGELPEVPRNRTFIFSPWQFWNELPNTDNWNIYNQGPAYNNQREMGLKGVYEALFYTNLNTGELIPWQAESFEYNADFTEITLKLRDGVTWCDGVQMTADDVKFTIEALRDVDDPAVTYSTIYKEWIDEVEVVDPLTAVIKLTKAGPRWFRDNLALGHENHQVMLPKHIWENEDFKAFRNLDLEAGHPCGTGPYRIVASSPQQMVADRRDTWWGVETGFMPRMPNPERLILIPVATDEAMSQLHIANQIDTGNPLQPGTFVASQAQNPNLRSWYPEGPVWGAADGCGYVFNVNNMKEPWNDVNVRLALNYAINRQEISDFGYEGANYPIVAPFSAYMAGPWGIRTPLSEPETPSALQAKLDEYDRITPSQEKVDEHMTAAGYARNADGKWEKDGEVLHVPVFGPAFFQPSFEIVSQNFIDAGFDSSVEVAATDPEWVDRFLPGNYDTLVFVHCGSLAEPYDTLKHLHSKNAQPIGTNITDVIAGTRYTNPELDAILDQMEAIPADNTPDSEYMNLAVQALDIYLRDMPEIMLTEELHVVTYNTTYWTGYPDASDPYIAPYPCWEAINLLVHRLEPTGAA